MISEFFINENDKIFALTTLKEYLKQLDECDSTILLKSPKRKKLEIQQNNYFIRLRQKALIIGKIESFFIEIYDEESIIKESLSIIYQAEEDYNYYIEHTKMQKEGKISNIISDKYYFGDNDLKRCHTQIVTVSRENLKKYIKEESNYITKEEQKYLIEEQGNSKEQVIIMKKRLIDFSKILKYVEKIEEDEIEYKNIKNKQVKLIIDNSESKEFLTKKYIRKK